MCSFARPVVAVDERQKRTGDPSKTIVSRHVGARRRRRKRCAAFEAVAHTSTAEQVYLPPDTGLALTRLFTKSTPSRCIFGSVLRHPSCDSPLELLQRKHDRRVTPDRRAHPRGGRRGSDLPRDLSLDPCDQCGATDIQFVAWGQGFEEYRCRHCHARLFRLPLSFLTAFGQDG